MKKCSTQPWNKFQGYNIGHAYGIEMLIKSGLSFRLSGRQERTEESGDSSLKWTLI